MENLIFIEIGNNTTQCQYCNSDIIYNGDGGKRGYTIKKCPDCGINNGIAVNIKCDVVSFKLRERKGKNDNRYNEILG